MNMSVLIGVPEVVHQTRAPARSSCNDEIVDGLTGILSIEQIIDHFQHLVVIVAEYFDELALVHCEVKVVLSDVDGNLRVAELDSSLRLKLARNTVEFFPEYFG